MVVAGLSHRRIFLFERHRVGCRGRRYHRCSEPEALARGDDRRRQRVLRRGVLRPCVPRGDTVRRGRAARRRRTRDRKSTRLNSSHMSISYAVFCLKKKKKKKTQQINKKKIK